MKGSEQREEMPKWLKNLQENSWELELLISGGAIFSLFQLSDFFIDWVQAMRVTNHLRGSGIAMIVGMFGIKVLTLGFSLHLILRAYWLALICINYVFPGGINSKRIYWKKPFRFDSKTVLDLRNQIVAVDKNCGLVMYMSIISAFTIFGLLFLAIFLVPINYSIHYLFNGIEQGLIFDISINLILIYILDLISFGLLRKIPFLSYLIFPLFKFFDLFSFRSVYQKSLWLFSTNVKKLRFFLGALIFASFAMLNAYSALYKVQHWPNVLDDRDYRWQRTEESLGTYSQFNLASDGHYMEYWNGEHSRPFGIASKIVEGNLLEVYIRYDKATDVLVDAVDRDPEKRYFSEIIEVKVNDIAQEINWHTTSKYQDLGIMGMLDLSTFEDGEYMLSISTKEKYHELHKEFVNRPMLVKVPFWIDRPAMPELILPASEIKSP